MIVRKTQWILVAGVINGSNDSQMDTISNLFTVGCSAEERGSEGGGGVRGG